MTRYYYTLFDNIHNDTKHNTNTFKIDKTTEHLFFQLRLMDHYFKQINGSYTVGTVSLGTPGRFPIEFYSSHVLQYLNEVITKYVQLFQI